MIRLKVKEVAQQKGVSQGKLSRISDVDLNTVRRTFQNPLTVVQTTTLDRLANALGVHVCELIEYTPDDEG